MSATENWKRLNMPHELPDPQDYHDQHARQLAEQEAETARIYEICNASLRCAIECPLPVRTPEDCAACGNEPCLKAKAALDALWSDKSI